MDFLLYTENQYTIILKKYKILYKNKFLEKYVKYLVINVYGNKFIIFICFKFK